MCETVCNLFRCLTSFISLRLKLKETADAFAIEFEAYFVDVKSQS